MLSSDRLEQLLRELTLEEKVSLVTGKDMWTTAPVSRLGIPSIWLSDGPHGVRRMASSEDIGIGETLSATCFPTASALAASWDVEMVAEVGRAIARECRAQGVHVLLGPGVNIKRSPLGGRNFEYFSEDPVLTGEMAVAFVRAVQGEGIGTSVKHFACNNQEFERMTISAEVDERTLREVYLAAFERVVREARPWTVMAAYNRINGVAATENAYLLTEILKKEWEFEGCVVSDWYAVNCKEKALAAGLDLEMPANTITADAASLVRAVREGRLAEEAINKAARRVLRLVLQAAVQEHKPEGATFDEAAHHALARRAAGECMVLLKNDGPLLPLAADKLRRLAVIGRFAREPRYQGAGSSQVNPTRLDNAYDAIAALLPPEAQLAYAAGYGVTGEEIDTALLEEAVAAARAAEAAVVFIGLPPRYEVEGYDRQHMNLPDAHNRLVEEVCRVQPNTAVVLANGSAVTMPWLEKPRAVIEGWLGGQAAGGAAADVLFGAVNPSGKLSETFPRRLEDTPAYLNFPGEEGRVRYGEGLFVGYKYYEKKKIKPLFAFGFGLSYTTFEYSNLALSAEKITDADELKVTLQVKNTGQVAGKEVVQLYLRDEASRLQRPEKELKAFTKVALLPGETKTVALTLRGRDFAFYDSLCREWCVEAGWFEILVGASSEDIRMRARVYVEPLRSPRPTLDKWTPLSYFLADERAKAVLQEELGDSPLLGVLLSAAKDDEFRQMMESTPLVKILGFAGAVVPEAALDRAVARINAAPVE